MTLTKEDLKAISTLIHDEVQELLVPVNGELRFLRTELLALKKEVLLIKEDVQILKNRIRSLENEVQSLKDRVQSLENKVQSLENEVQSLKDRIQSLENETQSLKSELQETNRRVSSLELHLENQTDWNVRLIAENFIELTNKLNQAIPAANKNLAYEVQVNYLTIEVEKLKEEVALLKGRTA